MQIRFEGRIFFSSNKSCIQKVFSIALVRETLRVSLHLFWTWPSTKNFYEITEDSSFSVISSEHTNHNISWTECVNSLYNRRNISGQGQSKLPFSTSKICAEFKKTSFAAAQRIQFLAVTLINHDPVSNREETVESSEAVSRTSQETQVSVLELTKQIGLLSSTIQPVLSLQINFRYLKQQQIQALKHRVHISKKLF